MNDSDFRSNDRDLEEALAYAARLKATHDAETSAVPAADTTTPAAPQVPVAEKPTATAPSLFGSAKSITLPDDTTTTTTTTVKTPVAPYPAAAEPTAEPRSPHTASTPTAETAKPAAVSLAKAAARPTNNAAAPASAPAASDENTVETPGRFLRILYRIIPVAGDPWWEIGRKLVFLVALIVLIGSSAMLLNESVILPSQNETMQNELLQLLEQSRNGQLTEAEAAYDGYPDGISVDFKKLYYQNNDVRGRLVYSPCGVDNVVLYSGDNSYYLTHDFYRNTNKHGTLFLDANNNLNSPSANFKSLVIYGHNMASGQMFAGLNQLAGSVDTMRRAGCTVTLDTLFDTRQYKIFAVIVQDPNADIEHYFSIQETSFSGSGAFMDYVQNLRARSLYDFNGVDVNADDNILIMYTCSPKSVSSLSDGRLAVVARQVRAGESAGVDTSTITENKDVIMPYAWYVANKKTPHSFYSTGDLTPEEPVVPDDPDTDGNPDNEDSTTPNTPNGTQDPTDPAPPTNPVRPTNPVTPTNPPQPTEPSDGTDPTAPNDGTDPTEPTDPAEPTEPTDSTTDPSTPVDGTTGDGDSTTATDPADSSDSTTPNAPTDTEPTATEAPAEPDTTPTDPPAPADGDEPAA